LKRWKSQQTDPIERTFGLAISNNGETVETGPGLCKELALQLPTMGKTAEAGPGLWTVPQQNVKRCVGRTLLGRISTPAVRGFELVLLARTQLGSAMQ